MKYQKDKAIVFKIKYDCEIKFGADKKVCGTSASLVEYIEREFKIRASDFLAVSNTAASALKMFSLN